MMNEVVSAFKRIFCLAVSLLFVSASAFSFYDEDEDMICDVCDYDRNACMCVCDSPDGNHLDENGDNYCDYCAVDLSDSGDDPSYCDLYGHEYSFSHFDPVSWIFYHECSVCGDEDACYDDGVDGYCDVCGHALDCPHNWISTPDYHECSICGEIEDHVGIPCSVCGYSSLCIHLSSVASSLSGTSLPDFSGVSVVQSTGVVYCDVCGSSIPVSSLGLDPSSLPVAVSLGLNLYDTPADYEAGHPAYSEDSAGNRLSATLSSVLAGSVDVLTSTLGVVWGIITGNLYLCILAGAGILSLGFVFYRKSKRTAIKE